ncbi:hypothetical protein C5167_023261 [Papaver somniferum]|uniref:Uncharacterized protein n=1 Tax=Papaver somniferum TaxID=3469 RepID=A0A4Y7JK97_PAPSO|nr:hypothetical protein C5167_023261 [Papaver somniferum]
MEMFSSANRGFTKKKGVTVVIGVDFMGLVRIRWALGSESFEIQRSQAKKDQLDYELNLQGFKRRWKSMVDELCELSCNRNCVVWGGNMNPAGQMPSDKTVGGGGRASETRLLLV